MDDAAKKAVVGLFYGSNPTPKVADVINGLPKKGQVGDFFLLEEPNQKHPSGVHRFFYVPVLQQNSK